VLSEQQKEQFEKNQSRAQELFSSFRTKFKAEFPEIYFYFFAEGRYNFSEFVRAFRPEVGMNFFIYQVGARDRIRLDPRADGMYCASGHGYGLDCKMFHHPMPNIDTDVLVAQQLE
jgi:cell fate regulator YaaT (PSP1 superfamily)